MRRLKSLWFYKGHLYEIKTLSIIQRKIFEVYRTFLVELLKAYIALKSADLNIALLWF